MKNFFLLLSLSTILGACQYNTPRKQRWYLESANFMRPNKSMELKISSARIMGDSVQLRVHVTDSTQRHYRNIPTDWFCRLAISQNNGQQVLQRIKVTEHKVADAQPAAIAIVLDYSGSMTWKKEKLFNLTQEFVEQKREEDAYSILRYADIVGVDVPLTKDKNVLKSEFTQIPVKSLGASTATWDAVTEGIKSIENSPYEEKILIVLTDGQENASKVTEQWAYWRAKKSGVKIVSISLGLDGSDNMHKLCKNTGGMYTYINNIQEVKQAYIDFVNKRNSFYEISFNTPFVGRQTVQLDLCDNIALRSSYIFDNTPPAEEPQRLKIPPQTPPAVQQQTAVTSATEPEPTRTPEAIPDEQPASPPTRQPQIPVPFWRIRIPTHTAPTPTNTRQPSVTIQGNGRSGSTPPEQMRSTR